MKIVIFIHRRRPSLRWQASLAWLAAIALWSGGDLNACTLWGSAGTNASGGTIISKNRDWKPDHTQVLKLHRGPGSYAYFGLYAEGNNEPGLKGGVNEKGLTVVTATASSIPEASRAKQPGKRGALAILLANYATCDEIVARLEAIFPRTRTGFFLIADRRKILVVEVGLDGKFAHRLVERGSVALSFDPIQYSPLNAVFCSKGVGGGIYSNLWPGMPLSSPRFCGNKNCPPRT